MSTSTHANALIQALGHRLGTTPMPGASNTLALRYADGRRCVLTADGDEDIHMLAPLAVVHDYSRPALFAAALRLNARPTQTGDGIVGYSGRRSQIELSRYVIARGLDVEAVATLLGEFLHTAIALSNALEDAVRHGECL